VAQTIVITRAEPFTVDEGAEATKDAKKKENPAAEKGKKPVKAKPAPKGKTDAPQKEKKSGKDKAPPNDKPDAPASDGAK
jgi:hypothetical protein